MPRLTQERVDWTRVLRILRETQGTFHQMSHDQILREIERARNEPRYFTTFINFLDLHHVHVPLRHSADEIHIVEDLFDDDDDQYCDYCGNREWLDQPANITDEEGRHYHGRCFTMHRLNLLQVQPDHGHDLNRRADDHTTCLACHGLRSDAAHVDTGLGPIHRSCLRTRVERLVCACCGSFGSRLNLVSGLYLCPTCERTRPVRCNSCGATHRLDEGMVRVHPTDDRGFLCPGCAHEMFRCTRCQQLVKVKSKKTDGLCLACFVRSNPARRIHRYNLKPKPKFHGKDTKRQYGLELEVDAFPSNDHNRFGLGLLYKAEKGESAFYIKNDGSLNNGFELVFHPRELGSWYSYEKKLQALTDAVQSADGRSFNTSTCGIHVHRGVDDISGYHIVKMSYLLAKFRKLTRAVALRDPNHYAQEVRIFNGDPERSVDPRSTYYLFKQTLMSPRDRRYNVERYLQLNFQNEHTIELRIFRGNLNVTTILACIMFFDRLVEFTRKQTIKAMEQMSESDMIALFNGFCKNMTTRSTLGKRKNNAFAIVSSKVTDRIAERLNRVLNPGN